jgi:5-methylcytosine-specific restriction endonuclease McrA
MDTLFPQSAPDLCRVCDEPVVDGRWNYCSERCREIAQAVQKMFLWDEVREKILLKRDDYTCQQCGASQRRQWRAYHTVRHRIDERTEHLRDADENMDEWRQRRRELREKYDVEAPTDGYLQIDHITRIADGGHPFDESNLQTLCEDCHGQKTAQENQTDGSDPSVQGVTLADYME